VAALTSPSQQIDGDCSYCSPRPPHWLAVLVADVMGKGLPTALLGAATKRHGLEALCRLLALSRHGHLPAPKDIVTLAHAAMVPHLMALARVVTLCDAR
jgi:sigma-B regulation protein RsbU (phosphoserine phosphatase)